MTRLATAALIKVCVSLVSCRSGQHLMGRYLKVARAKDVQVPQANTGKEKPPGERAVSHSVD